MTRAPAWLRRHPFVLACLGIVVASASVWAVPAQVRIPIVRDAKLDPPGAGTFSHWRHEQYQCVACHPTIFPRAHKGFTHDGRTTPPASGARANCKTSCHAP